MKKKHKFIVITSDGIEEIEKDSMEFAIATLLQNKQHKLNNYACVTIADYSALAKDYDALM